MVQEEDPTTTQKCLCFGTPNCRKQKHLLYRNLDRTPTSYCDVCNCDFMLKRISGLSPYHFIFILMVVLGVGLAILYESFGLVLFCVLAYREKWCMFANSIIVSSM